MLQQLFGTELAFPIRVAVALGVIAALLGVTVVVMRRLAARSRAGSGRGGRPGPRLAVIDTVALDQRRKLVLIRRDNVEHLLLIGGNSDIVVEPQIGARAEDAAASFTAATIAPPREPTPLQRAAPRQRLSAATPTALAAPAEPAEAPEPAAPTPAPETPAEPPRRAPLGRKPLLRGDGTMSVARAPQRTIPGRSASEAEATASPSAGAQAPAPPHFIAPAIAPIARDAEPARRAPALEPRPDPRAEGALETRAERAPEAAPAVSLAAESALLETLAPGSRLDVMAQRLDAALKEPTPQLSLADLLGDAPEAAASGTPDVAAGPEQDRTTARFALRPRGEPRVGIETARGRQDPLPRFERPAVAGRPETQARPREFAFRPNPEADGRDDETKRELPPPRESGARDMIQRPIEPQLREPSLKTADNAADLRKTFDMPPRPMAELPAPEPRAATPRDDDAPAIPPAPTSQTPVDPLDDFDAEMANLLGRNTARIR